MYLIGVWPQAVLQVCFVRSHNRAWSFMFTYTTRKYCRIFQWIRCGKISRGHQHDKRQMDERLTNCIHILQTFPLKNRSVVIFKSIFVTE
ncbi:hypothetical protein GDO78_001645 [Eleutherodactylus coqui]|uniref:Uncharacterized protein n=1 Tax=Eleutherodactylus coqui TaxID=57060 RepID=A0A8J6FW35_ELECQ|nr:hypothetical protein GDO78_001645 [Eleutherodactylus coqui]